MRRTTHRYGTRRGQVAELLVPDGVTGNCPVVVVVHGGFWRAQYTRHLTRGLTRALTAQGWATWNIEYARVGRFAHGGWPTTLTDAAAAVDALEQQDALDLARVVTCGHSAGGHLALWLAARSRLAAGDPGTPVRVPVRGAMSLAGMGDLRAAAALDLGAGAVTGFLGGAPDDVPDRYRCASPAEHLPLGMPQVLVHGLTDTVVPASLSEDYVAAARAAGDHARYVPVAGADHRDVARPRGASWSAVTEHLAHLLD